MRKFYGVMVICMAILLAGCNGSKPSAADQTTTAELTSEESKSEEETTEEETTEEETTEEETTEEETTTAEIVPEARENTDFSNLCWGDNQETIKLYEGSDSSAQEYHGFL